MHPSIIISLEGSYILGEVGEDNIVNGSFLDYSKPVSKEDMKNYAKIGLPKEIVLTYKSPLRILADDEFYPCNPNVVFASYQITDKVKGVLWYKDEKKLLDHNDPLILEMVRQNDFYALWDYLEDKNDTNLDKIN